MFLVTRTVQERRCSCGRNEELKSSMEIASPRVKEPDKIKTIQQQVRRWDEQVCQHMRLLHRLYAHINRAANVVHSAYSYILSHINYLRITSHPSEFNTKAPSVHEFDC
jgi:hypothetical protein